MRSVRAMVAAVFLATGFTACDPSAGRSGGPSPRTELVLTNNDGGGSLRVVPAIEYFVERVAELSGGRLVVVWEPGEWATDGRELTTVADGSADLGWVGTRVFDLLGVDAFRPLHAPLLVDSYALQAAVVRHPAAGAALEQLSTFGVEPLALLADELQFPASVDRPLDSARVWVDAGVWLLESDALADAVEAFGGRPLNTFADGGDIRLMLQTGEADGLSMMWIYYVLNADYQHSPYVVPNVVLGARTLALFADPEALADLTGVERGWVEQAAADTADWAAEHTIDRVAGLVAEACRHGARIAYASEPALAELRGLAGSLVAHLRGDPATAELTAAVEVLAAETGGDAPLVAPAGCVLGATDGVDDTEPRLDPLLGPGPTGDLPLGTYRYALAADEIVVGQEVISTERVDTTLTWTLGPGEWTLVARPVDGALPAVTCRGWFAVEGMTVRFTLWLDQAMGHCLPLDWAAEWSADGDGNLRWAGVMAGVLRPHFAATVWQPIG